LVHGIFKGLTHFMNVENFSCPRYCVRESEQLQFLIWLALHPRMWYN